MGTWRCYAKGTVANLPVQRLRMEPMGRNDSLTPLRYESAAQEKRNERAAETKNTDRLLKILAKKRAAHCQGRLIPPTRHASFRRIQDVRLVKIKRLIGAFVFLGG
jgi:hypothetical protein